MNEQRLVNLFTTMVQIDSPSLQERKMADFLIQYFKERNISVIEDDAGKKSNGNAGNLIVHIPGTIKKDPIGFTVHMDQVAPCIGVKPQVGADGVIRSDGTTTLGGDDKAGIAILLEALETVRENKIPHRDLYFFISICEETGMHGSRNLDPKMLPVKDVIAIDSGGPVGGITTEAIAKEKIDITFQGKPAHAGVAIQDGINSIVMAAKVITKIRSGQVDKDTTLNIAVVSGGESYNIVPEHTLLKIEYRSFNGDMLSILYKEIIQACEEVSKEMGGSFTYVHERQYGALKADPNSLPIQLLVHSMQKLGIEHRFQRVGGGSDANVLASLGYNTTNISIGQTKAHTLEESIKISDMKQVVEIIQGVMTNDSL